MLPDGTISYTVKLCCPFIMLYPEEPIVCNLCARTKVFTCFYDYERANCRPFSEFWYRKFTGSTGVP